MHSSKNILFKLFVAFGSLVFTILFSEFFVFRFVFLPSDFPENEFTGGVIKYKPFQKGVYRIKNAIRANYKINANGWNSGYDRYEPKKTQGKYRIAVVG